jgi:tRNA U34 5-methylaminomethyl-2-thiouridine-forming methyltransferase MnmC
MHSERILQLTADGSHTLFLPEINEHYHSINGAVQEALHVYINAGFNLCRKENIRVLELGFGAGLNVLLTAMESRKRGIEVSYTSIENDPLPQAIINQLNYIELDKALFQQIHAAEWNKAVPLLPSFTLHKIEADFTAFNFNDYFDVIYYDAFAPDKQAEVWSQELFDRIFRVLNPGGILTTYCAKGNIRRMLQQAGFAVERIPGPPGKREMLRACSII